MVSYKHKRQYVRQEGTREQTTNGGAYLFLYRTVCLLMREVRVWQSYLWWDAICLWTRGCMNVCLADPVALAEILTCLRNEDERVRRAAVGYTLCVYVCASVCVCEESKRGICMIRSICIHRFLSVNNLQYFWIKYLRDKYIQVCQCKPSTACLIIV